MSLARNWPVEPRAGKAWPGWTMGTLKAKLSVTTKVATPIRAPTRPRRGNRPPTAISTAVVSSSTPMTIEAPATPTNGYSQPNSQ